MNEAWTEQEFQRAAELWAKAHSLGDIAREINKSRAAVGGMMARNREVFPKKTDTIIRIEADAQPKPERGRHNKVTPTIHRLFERDKIDALAPPPAATPVNFLLVSDRQCKWPLWAAEDNPGPDGLCCGARIDFGAIYCLHHRQVSTGKGTPSERAAPRMLERMAG